MALLPSNEISDTPDFCKENSKQLTFVTITPIENKVQIVTQHQKLVNTEEDQKTGPAAFKVVLDLQKQKIKTAGMFQKCTMYVTQ